jgi:transposase-like protein
MKLAEIVKEVQKLDEMAQQRLLTFLQTSLAHSIHGKEPLLKEIAEGKNKKGFVCPHCQNKNVVRFGTYKTKVGSNVVVRQRYKCNDCSKTFIDLTNTPLNKTRMEKWKVKHTTLA